MSKRFKRAQLLRFMNLLRQSKRATGPWAFQLEVICKNKYVKMVENKRRVKLGLSFVLRAPRFSNQANISRVSAAYRLLELCHEITTG